MYMKKYTSMGLWICNKRNKEGHRFRILHAMPQIIIGWVQQM